MSKVATTAISPTRQEDYPQWYQQVIVAADLAENSPVRGCMVIKPWGYALWELIQEDLNKRFRDTGHVNAYFPLLIPLSYLEKEAKHVEGFAKECAVVTHHRLVDDGTGSGQLKPDGKLEEPLIIRPTSETIIGQMYAKWVKSYRDLPILINQWANVMRWELRTRLFLRTAEFLWQEGHTAHASEEEAKEEAKNMLNVYADFAKEFLAIPVIQGEKTVSERFPGAVTTYTIEAMMQDGKALQAGTSHFLGQNFAQASNIKFLNKNGKEEYAWTTSWGVSTRLIGGLIMTHSDDNGLVLPPHIAPHQVVIVPIYRNDEDKHAVLTYCDNLKQELAKIQFGNAKLRIYLDKRDVRGGEKNWQWIKKGVPIRLEVGLREVKQNTVVLMRRDSEDIKHKDAISADLLVQQISDMLQSIHNTLYDRALQYRLQNTHQATSVEHFKELFNKGDVFVTCHAVDGAEMEMIIKSLQVTSRCICSTNSSGVCIFTSKPTNQQIVFARAY